MSLKDLISTLIESAFTSKKEFIVQQTYLDYSKNVVIRNDTINTAENISYVAPGDGVIVSYLNDKTSINGIMTTLSSMSLVNFGAVTGVASTATFAPVKKGEGVTIFTKTFDYANRVVRYIPYLGGGYKRFIFNVLQRFGGGLCLSYLATFERSLSCQALKHCRAVRALICRSLPQVSGVKLLQQHLMAMLRHSFSTQKQSNSQTSQQKLEQKSRQTYRQELIYPFAKVISLMCTSITQIQLMPFLNSLKPSALLSLCKEVCHG